MLTNERTYEQQATMPATTQLPPPHATCSSPHGFETLPQHEYQLLESSHLRLFHITFLGTKFIAGHLQTLRIRPGMRIILAPVAILVLVVRCETDNTPFVNFADIRKALTRYCDDSKQFPTVRKTSSSIFSQAILPSTTTVWWEQT